MSTPLNELDEAIHTYIKTFDPEAAVSGWVLVYQTSYIQTEDEEILPLVFDQSFTMGPGVSGALGVGLIDMTKDWILRHLNDTQGEDDEDS